MSHDSTIFHYFAVSDLCCPQHQAPTDERFEREAPTEARALAEDPIKHEKGATEGLPMACHGLHPKMFHQPIASTYLSL